MINELVKRYPALAKCEEDTTNAKAALVECFQKGGKLLLGELMKGFRSKRPLSEEKKAQMRAAYGNIDEGVLAKLQNALPAISLPSFTALNMAFANDAMELQGDALCGKAFDDRACLVCLLHAMELLQGKQLAVNVVVSASTKEETGFQGGISAGFKVQPEYAIAVDVTHARTGDAPQVIVKLGDGPNVDIGHNSNPRFARKVIEVARAKQIPHIVTSCPSASGTNAWPIQMQGQGVTTLVVSLPLKYMHSPVEMLRISDVKNVGKLIAAFIETFDGRL